MMKNEVKYYEIKYEPYTFQATIIKDIPDEYYHVAFGDKTSYFIYIFDWTDKCIYLDLGNLKFPKRHKMISMIKTSLKFLCELFPYIERVRFLYERNKIINYLYIVKYRQTWYEYKFNAIPYIDDTYYKSLKEVNDALDKPIDITFDEFYEKYMKINRIRKKNLESDFINIYEKSKSYREFLKILVKNYPKHLICQEWFPYFMIDMDIHRLHLEGTFFKIERDIIDSWSTNITYSIQEDSNAIIPFTNCGYIDFDIDTILRKQ
jgi:hypothetical protein